MNIFILVLIAKFVVNVMGVNVKSTDPSFRIIKGYPCDVETYPFYVKIMTFQINSTSVCGGSIITADWIISAAHCFFNKTIEYVHIIPGYKRINFLEVSILLKGHELNHIHMHPKYDSDALIHDIALVKLNPRLNFTDFIKPIKIPSTDDFNEFCSRSPRTVTIMGLGLTFTDIDRKENPDLQCVEVDMFTHEECNKKISKKRQISEFNICTFPGYRKGTCFGDSGGPVFKNGYLFGIVSYIRGGCGWKDFHVRVDLYNDWIWNVVNATNENVTNENSTNDYLCSTRTYPFYVEIKIIVRYKVTYCEGAIINADWIISAAHCFFNKPKIWLVFINMRGQSEIQSLRNPTSDHIRIHPKFDNKIMMHDIVLIKLKQTLKDPNLAKLKIPSTDDFDEFCARSPRTVTIMGLGKSLSDANDTRPNLHCIDVEMFTQEECNKDPEEHQALNCNVCTFIDSKKGPCISHSGGPVFKNGYLFGIVSYTRGPCGWRQFLTRVDLYNDWIWNVVNGTNENVTNENVTSGDVSNESVSTVGHEKNRTESDEYDAYRHNDEDPTNEGKGLSIQFKYMIYVLILLNILQQQ